MNKIQNATYLIWLPSVNLFVCLFSYVLIFLLKKFKRNCMESVKI